MIASTGDSVSPGIPVVLPEGVEIGTGLYNGKNGVIASFTGKLEINDGILNLIPDRPQVNIPKIESDIKVANNLF